MSDPFTQLETIRYCEKMSSDQKQGLLQEVLKSTFLNAPKPYDTTDFLQGQFLRFLSAIIHPRTILEIGSFTGFGTVCLSEGLKKDGKIITIELREELAPLINKHLKMAGIHEKVELKFGNAKEVLTDLDEEIDLAYIDASKVEYLEYYYLLIDKISPNGIIIADNVLWKGKVVKGHEDRITFAIHRFNLAILNDSRVSCLILPIGDGISLIRKLS